MPDSSGAFCSWVLAAAKSVCARDFTPFSRATIWLSCVCAMVKYGTAAAQPQLPLYRAGETTDDVPFGEDEEAECRDHRRRRVREDARGVLRVLRLERGDAEGQREVVRVAQYEQ